MALTKNSQIDLNGNEMILDADADTSITADTDDQIDVKIAGSDNIKITASAFEIGTTAPKINLKNTDTSIIADQSLGVIEIESTDGSTGSAGTIAKLDIAASGAFDGSGHGSQYRFSTGATNQSGSIALTEQMRLSDVGNLHLSGGSDRRIQLGSGGAGANQVSNNTVHIRGDGATMKFMAASGGSYQYEINGTEVARIDSNGDMAIRTTDTTAALTVSQVDNDNPVARFDIACGALNAIVGMQLRVTAGTANAANKYFLQGDDNGNTRVELRTNGDVYSSSGSYTSDVRLKENIEDCEPMLEKLKQVRIVDFDWKENAGPEGRQRGVIAQEIESIFPELIQQPNEYKEFKKSEMTPILVKAIQAQQEQIELLQQQIEVLKNGN